MQVHEMQVHEMQVHEMQVHEMQVHEMQVHEIGGKGVVTRHQPLPRGRYFGWIDSPPGTGPTATSAAGNGGVPAS
jgi:hypothetical protein